jgi:hypothetical protein
MNNRTRPEETEYAKWYAAYVAHAKGHDFVAALRHADERFHHVLSNLTQQQAEKTYAPGKWTVLDLMQHLIDSEWVFTYRALRFARYDTTDLPGYDHDNYVLKASANSRSLEELTADMKLLRLNTISLFESFSDAALLNQGTANGNLVSVRALAWITAGHQLHHLSIIEERYLPVI